MLYNSTTFLLQSTPLFTLFSGPLPVLITFSPKKYVQAQRWLQEKSGEAVRSVPAEKHPFAEMLPRLLWGEQYTTSLPPSPFFDRATSFQREVLELLMTIPYGETRTYGELALQLGGRGYARAVGQACNANPLAILIPCHRVVSTQGVGGYAGGSALKQYLLELERQASLLRAKDR